MEKIKLTKEDQKVFYGCASKELIDFCIAMDRNYDPQWFHEEIAKALQKVATREIKRLIIEMPPRHGKSELVTINFPAWYLGKEPQDEIMTASYSGDLAQKFGGRCRDLMDSPVYKHVFPQVKLKQDTKSKDYWRTDKGGGYMSVGVGGAATGSGADCIAEGQRVITEGGEKLIEEIKIGERVLTFNEKNRFLEWKKVLATRCIKDRDVVSLSGRLICTPDHRVYDGSKYIPAKDVKSVYVVLPNSMRIVWENFRKAINGMEKEKTNKILFIFVCSRSAIKEMVSILFGLWSKNEARIKKGLFKLFSARTISEETKNHSSSSVWFLWKAIYREVFEKSVLFHELQKSFTFNFNAGTQQSKMEKWFRQSSLQSLIFDNKKENSTKGQLHLRDLPASSDTRSSFRREQIQRRLDEFNFSLHPLSYDNPQVQELRPNETFSVGKRTVYDLQIEDNRNFFVNGLLVHNCLLIDDPIKNREEADSEVYREKVWDWYTNVARTRLEKDGAIIIIMTRWHPDDLVGRVLEREAEGGEKWHRVTFPALAETNDRFRDVEDPLWPEKYSKEDLANIRGDIGERAWFALYQQKPIASETQVFQPEWMKREFMPEDLEQKTLNRYITIDTADTDKEGADYIGVTEVDWDSENNWYFQTVRRYRLNILGLVDLVFNLWNGRKPLKIGIEKKSFQDQLKPLLDERSEETGIFPVIEELKHLGRHKEARIIGALQGRFEKGKIWFKKGAKDDTEAMKRELFDFPKGKNDDLIDAASYIQDIGARPFSPQKNVQTTMQSEMDDYFRSKRAKASYKKI